MDDEEIVPLFEEVRALPMRHILERRSGKLLFLFNIFFLFYLAACARLPEYAKPHFNLEFKERKIDPEAFSYRLLTKDDFQARSLPEGFTQYSGRINARSCLSVRSTEHTQMRIAASSYSGNDFYIGSIEKIDYEAVFKPSCSWWNQQIPRQREPYVLEHEQIHFALLELAARQLSQTSEQKFSSYIAIGNSVDEVKGQLLEKVQEIGQGVMRANLKVQTSFDEATSLYYDPASQKEWYADVMERLKEKKIQSHKK